MLQSSRVSLSFFTAVWKAEVLAASVTGSTSSPFLMPPLAVSMGVTHMCALDGYNTLMLKILNTPETTE